MRKLSHACSLLLAATLLQWFALPQAHAACGGQRYIKECDGAQSEVEAAKTAMASGASAAAAAAGSRISGNGFSLSNVTKDGASCDTQAAAYCQKQLSQCQSSCNNPQNPQDMQDLKQCNQKIPPQIAKSQESAKNLANDSGNSKNSGQQSSGMPPMSPPPSPSPDATPSSTPTPDHVADGSAQDPKKPDGAPGFSASCSSDGAYVFDKCSTQLAANCNGNFKSSELCEKFSQRYCGAASSSSQASPGAMPAGQGRGSDFCSAYQGGDFCAKTPGSEVCPSCSHKPLTSEKLPDVCKGDPAFSNPALAQGAGASTPGGGSGGGGGGSGASPSAPSARLTDVRSADGQAAVSNLPKMGSLEAGGGGGGGGGSSTGGHDGGSADDSFSLNSLAGKRKTASAVADTKVAATDVSLKPQSLFELSSEVILQRCLKGQLLHCGSK